MQRRIVLTVDMNSLVETAKSCMPGSERHAEMMRWYNVLIEMSAAVDAAMCRYDDIAKLETLE